MFGRSGASKSKVLPTHDSSVSAQVDRMVHDIEDELSELAAASNAEVKTRTLNLDDVSDFDRLYQNREAPMIIMSSSSRQPPPLATTAATTTAVNSRAMPLYDDIADPTDYLIDIESSSLNDAPPSAPGKMPTSAAATTAVAEMNNRENKSATTRSKQQPAVATTATEEEIKLSHELKDGGLVIASEIEGQFAKLKKQIDEYKLRYSTAAEKLREAETKVADLTIQQEELLDENKKLEAENKEAALLTHSNANSRNSGVQRGRGVVGLTPDEELHKRSEQIRKALLLSDDNEDELEVALINSSSGGGGGGINSSCSSCSRAMQLLLVRLLPFKRDIRNIQARFGTSVASYFTFHRLVYLQFLLLAAFFGTFLVLHLITLVERSSNVFKSPGYLPNLMLFSSFSSSRKERLYYCTMVITPCVFITLLLIERLVAEHRGALTFAAVQAENEIPLSREVLCAWDFSTTVRAEVDDFSGKLGNTFLQLLEDVHSLGRKKSRSRYELFLLVLRRLLGVFLYVLLMCASVTSIIYITINSSSISERAKSLSGLGGNIGSLIAPFALNLINAAMPVLLSLTTRVEKWDTAQMELNLLLLRVFISSTVNSVILAFSYLLLIDPFLLAEYPQLRRSIELKVNPNFPCRYDQAADGLFSLVGLSWALNVAGLLAAPVSSRLLAALRGKEWIKPEFKVAESMVKKFSFLGLVFVSLPVAPLAIIFVPVYLFLGFKWEKLIIKRYYSKPKRPFQGQKAGLIFTFFYLITYVLLGLSVAGYVLTTKSMAKSCAVQDNYIRLCADEIGILEADICTADSSSRYYDFWGKENNYPRDVCEDACGPFVNLRFMAEPLKDLITGDGVLNIVWSIVFRFPYVPWAVVIILSVVIAMRNNANKVSKLSAYFRTRAMESQIQTIEAERKRQEKIIHKLRSIEYTEDHDNDDDERDQHHQQQQQQQSSENGKDNHVISIAAGAALVESRGSIVQQQQQQQQSMADSDSTKF